MFSALLICTGIIFVKANSVCENRNFSGPTGTISSPNYPYYYSNNLDCYSYISVPNSHATTITFSSFKTELTHDWVMITCVTGHNFSSPRYSGSALPAVLKIPMCNLVKVSFHTDGSETFGGFSLTYTIISDCGRTDFSGPAGQISSPNFPMAHNSYLDCSSYISVPIGQTLVITFVAFNFESPCGWVEITCAAGRVFRVPRYTRSELPPVLTISSCSRVNVSFHTDGSPANTGFSLKYNTTSDNVIGGFTTKPSNAFPRSDKNDPVNFNCTTTSEHLPWWTINHKWSRNYTITNSTCGVIKSTPYSSWFMAETLGPGSCNLIVVAPANDLYLLAGSLVCTDSTLLSARAVLAPINLELSLTTETKSTTVLTAMIGNEDMSISCNSSFMGWYSDRSSVFTYFLYRGGPIVQMRIFRTYWSLEGNTVSSIDTSDTSSYIVVKVPKDGVIPPYTCNVVCGFFSNISDLKADPVIELAFSTDPVNYEVLYKTYQNLKVQVLILGFLLGTTVLTTVILLTIIISRKYRKLDRNAAADIGHQCQGSQHELRQREEEGNVYYSNDCRNAAEVSESQIDDPDDIYEHIAVEK